MPAHWSMLKGRVEDILRKHGVSELGYERDWITATWLEASIGHRPRSIRMVINPADVAGVSIEDIELDLPSYLTAPSHLLEVAGMFAKASAAALEIVALTAKQEG